VAKATFWMGMSPDLVDVALRGDLHYLLPDRDSALVIEVLDLLDRQRGVHANSQAEVSLTRYSQPGASMTPPFRASTPSDPGTAI
jgi:hypothetical protein